MKQSIISIFTSLVLMAVLPLSTIAVETADVQDVGKFTNTFINETDLNSSVSYDNGDEFEEETFYGQEEDMGVEEEIESFDSGKVVSMSSLVYKYIWIPVLLAVLCVIALVYVNVAYKTEFATDKSDVHRSRRKKIR